MARGFGGVVLVLANFANYDATSRISAISPTDRAVVVAGRGTQRFSCDVVYGELGLLRLERLPLTAPPCASR